MTAQRGRDLLLKISDGAGFVSVAGLRARRLAFNAQAVDATDSGSAGRWRELLSTAGIRRASVAGGGIFRDAQSDALVRQAFFDGVAPRWQIVIPDFGTIEGPFQIVTLEYRGAHDGELAFDMTLESSGEISFAGAV
jgi:TP901-1 family phage major tail protein